MTITTRQYRLLLEALRRFTRFAEGRSLTVAWTGLGSASAYKPALDGGLMTYATEPNPGYSTWFRLTEAGAAIVGKWLDAGFTHRHIERGQLPD
jgi:hypothetical protein